MEEQWDIMDFKTLLYKIKNGDISIQEQIHIHNQTHDIQHNISFLDYLLKYRNIHKQNLYLTLSNIYGLFCSHLDEICENDTILDYITVLRIITVFVSITPGIFRKLSIHILISVMFGALIITLMSYCPVIS